MTMTKSNICVLLAVLFLMAGWVNVRPAFAEEGYLLISMREMPPASMARKRRSSATTGAAALSPRLVGPTCPSEELAESKSSTTMLARLPKGPLAKPV